MSVYCDIMSVSEIHKNSFIVFSVKAVLSVGTPLPKTSFEQTCADYRIAGEKGIASRLNDV